MKKSVVPSSLKEKMNGLVADRRKSLWVVFVLAVLAYSNIFPNSYVREDYDYITSWSLIHDLSNLPRFFVGFIPPDGLGDVYTPLKTLIHSLVYNLSAGNPLGFHIFSLFVHLAGVYIVYQLSLLLTANVAVSFLTGVLFAVHPVHVEAVTFMSAASDTLGIIFLFFSFYYYIKGVGYEGALTIKKSSGQVMAPHKFAGSPADYRRALVFAVLAIFTHELVLTLPLFFFFYDYFFSSAKRSLRSSLSRTAPFLLIIVLYFIVKWCVLGNVGVGRYLYDSFYLTMLVTVKAWAKYVGILIFPLVLSQNHIISNGIFSYAQDDFESFAVLSQSPLEPQVLVSFLILIGLIVAGCKAGARNPLVLFCLGLFFISLLPVSNLIPGTVYFAERYLYAGSWAFCLLVSCGVYRVYEQQKIGTVNVRRPLLIGFMVVLTVFYVGRTFLRNQDWKDQLSLYESTVKTNPQSAFLRNDLGIVYLYYGEFIKSKESFEKAIALKPEDPHFYFSAEETYSSLEDFDKAITSLKKAVELNPQFAEAYFNLAGIHAFLKKDEEARAYLQKAVDLYRQQNRIFEAGKAIISFESYVRLAQAESSAMPELLSGEAGR